MLKGELRPHETAELSKGRLRKRKEELKEALAGNVEEQHKRMMRTSMEHLNAMEEVFSSVEQKIQEKIERHFKQNFELLKTIPPAKDSASVIIAEMGVNMDLFPTEVHLSSWAGMSPGNNESAGKKKSGATTHGNVYLKTILTEFSWIASKMKGTYLWSKYQSLIGRKEKKKTPVAVGHKILISAYQILSTGCPTKSWGRTISTSGRKRGS